MLKFLLAASLWLAATGLAYADFHGHGPMPPHGGFHTPNGPLGPPAQWYPGNNWGRPDAWRGGGWQGGGWNGWGPRPWYRPRCSLMVPVLGCLSWE